MWNPALIKSKTVEETIVFQNDKEIIDKNWEENDGLSSFGNDSFF